MANNKQFDRLKSLLKDLFQLDQPELDFGLYKIMHAKSVQITRFLENDLLKEIEAAFGARDSANFEELFAQAKAKLFDSLGDTALDANGEINPAFAALPAGKKYLEDIANAQSAKDSLSADAEIYDHLYRFFERYYDNGDFMSRRYYARESDTRAAPYSVPYDGREVYLHWANKDQYYIKSGENFTHYTFDLIEAVKKHLDSAKTNGQHGAFDFEVPTTATGEQKAMKVHLRIAEAQEGEHGNIKSSGDQKREFIPLLSKPAELDADGSLVLNFEFKVLPEGYPFDEAKIKARFGSINKEHMAAHWMADVFLQAMAQLPEGQTTHYMRLLNLLAPTEKQTKRPLLAKYISLYTARNTMDYFIHKDLGGFLRRELDFYIKNEVMRLDDIENADAPKVELYLGKVKVLRRIAHQLIAFLAQLEDFQKKLWLKKKFVTEVNYCITLDRIPEEFYSEIAANVLQHQDWIRLFEIDSIKGDVATAGYSNPLTVDFLKENQKLVVDTSNFDSLFTQRLLEKMHDLCNSLDGILINSDNFHALELMGRKFNKKVSGCYIDPPFNLGETGDYLYRVDYKDSTWLAFLQSRLLVTKRLLSNNGSQLVRCNHDGNMILRLLLNETYGHQNYRNEIIVRRAEESKGDLNKQFAGVKSITVNYDNIYWYSTTPETRFDRFMKPTKEGQGQAHWHSFWKAENRPNLRYDILGVDLRQHYGQWMWKSERAHRALSNYEYYLKNHQASQTLEDYWKEKKDLYKAEHGVELEFVYKFGSGYSSIKYWIPPRDFVMADNNWLDLKGYANSWSFKTENSEILLKRIVGTLIPEGGYFLDYFAGSGTSAATAHKLARKWITVEQGEHFDSVVKDRLIKVLNGESSGISKEVVWTGGGAFKYLRLESYEDALNNLIVADSAPRDRALDSSSELRSAYMLNYWLDVETQGSPSLLNVQAFADPTNYSMKIKRPDSDALALQRIDLLETFNWLIGLWVEHLAAPQTFSAEFEREVDKDLPKDQNTRLVCKRLRQDDQGPYWFRLVEGYTLKVPGDDSSRQKTLVVWRKLTDNPEQDNAALQKFLMEKLQISPRENTYAVIYVNGSHTLPNPLVEAEQTKVRLIEEAFHAAMWSQEAN